MVSEPVLSYDLSAWRGKKNLMVERMMTARLSAWGVWFEEFLMF